MSLSYATFTPDEIVIDPQGVVASINAACHQRTTPKKLQAVCEVGGAVHFVMKPVPAGDSGGAYHLVQLRDVTGAGFAATVNSHFQGSVDLAGTFRAHGTTYALFHELS
jgi:hypothetical protein